MRIGELSRRFGVPVETIRYYEREGLLPTPDRTASNYRAYGPAHDDRLRFIVNCRALDMSLAEIKLLLRYHDNPRKDCHDVTAVLDEHISHVAARVTELKHLERQLRELRRACRAGHRAGDCGILKSLQSPPRSRRLAGQAVSHGRRAH